MIRTKNVITNLKEIPVEWVFEFYLKLGEKLIGQDVKIKSVFNTEEKTPSLFIFYSKDFKRYYFKDFSSGIGGDHVKLVKNLYGYSTNEEAVIRIINDYKKYLLENDYKKVEIHPVDKYKVTDYKLRTLSEHDLAYWNKFGIKKHILEKYNVRAIDRYTIAKENGNNQINFRGSYIYGYFDQKGLLQKIYQPLNKERKFIKVGSYIQGEEQLTWRAPYLVICSSLKDIMGFNAMLFKNAEAVAPDSENSMLPEEFINKIKDSYLGVCTLFDNDEAGIKAMMKYYENYQIPYAHLKLEKDLTDTIYEHGINNTRIHLYPVLTKALTGKAKNLCNTSESILENKGL